MPTEQEQYEVCIDLVTMAGTEYTMQTNITHYEDMMQLEDDILCFLPTVSDIDVFGCEVDLRLCYPATLASSLPHSTNATKETADCGSAMYGRRPLNLAIPRR